MLCGRNEVIYIKSLNDLRVYANVVREKSALRLRNTIEEKRIKSKLSACSVGSRRAYNEKH